MNLLQTPRRAFSACLRLFLLCSFTLLCTSVRAQQTQVVWHFLDQASIPLPSADMPDYVKPLYTTEVDYKEVMEIHQEYYADRGLREWREDLERDPYAKFFHHWMQGAAAEVGAGGIVRRLSTTELLEKRAIITAKEQRMNAHNLDKSAATWSFVGPKRTVWRAEHRPNQQVAPWQVNIYAFAVAPSNSSILFATSETGEVYKTTDKGINWTPVMTYNWGGAGRAIAIHPTNPSLVFVSTNTDVVRSTDGGTTWASVLTVAGLSGNSLEFSPDGTTLIAGTGQGIMRSTDGGNTWNNQLSGEILDLAFRPGDNSTVYALLRQASPRQCMLYKSTDNGVSFSLSMSGWTPYADHSGGRITVTPADPDYLYVGLLQDPTNQKPVILKSTNSAGSWTQTAIGGTPGFDGTNGQGYYDLDIEASDLDAEELIFATTTAWRSADGGVSFTAIGGYSGPFGIHPDIQEIISLGGDTWIATDGGMNYSTDFFDDVANWEARIDGLDGTNFWGYDQGWNEDYMIGGRYHNGNTAMHENYPAQHALRMGGAESPTGHAWHGKPRHAIFDDISPTIIPADFTAEAEGSFSFSKFPNIWFYGSGYSSLLIDHEDYETFYVGEGNDFWQSEDGGNSWESLHSFGGEVYHFDISRANSDYVYLLARNGIYKSTDRGESFNAVSLPTGLSAYNASFGRIAASGTNPDELWLMDYRAGTNSSRNRVWFSNNGGSSWISWHTPALAGRQWTAMAHHVGSNGGVYIASDRGGNAGTMPAKIMYRDKLMTEWMDCSAGFPASANPQKMLPFYRDNVLRWAGNRGVWEMPLVEQNWSPIAQPFVGGSDVLCPNDPVRFDSYSVAKASATYNWSVPGAATTTALNQRTVDVTYAAPGTYTATMTVSQDGQTDSKSVDIVVGDNCTPDQFPGNSVVMGGTSVDYVTMKAPLNITTNTMTMSAWIKRDGQQVNTAGIISMGGSSNVMLNFHADTDNLSIHWNGAQWWWNSGLTVPDGEWTHVAMTVAPTQVILYVNGVPSVRNFAVGPAIFDGPIYFGRQASRGDRPYKGEMDEVVIYDRTLSQNEIRELMHLTRTPASETGILAYYQFNRDEGQVSNRATGIHAALSGSATRTTSTAPVGPGVSNRTDVNTAGSYSFGATGLALDFASETVPGGELCVTRIDISPDASPVVEEAINKYWVVHNYGSNNSFSELNGMTFSDVGVTTGDQATDPSSVKLFKRGSTAHGTTWGTAVADATSVTAGANGVVTFGVGNGQTSFSQFILGFEMPILGAELLQFTATVRDQKLVDLTWVSATEENLAYYELQRSAAGGDFVPLSEIAATGGVSVESYAYVDEAPLRGRSFYRLRMVDHDGTETFSEVRSVLFQGLAERVNVFPNPVKGGQFINVRTQDGADYTLDLFTAEGERVGTYEVAGDAVIRLPKLPAGVYGYQVRSVDYRSGGMLVIQ